MFPSFGEMLKYFRKQKKLSQQQLAKKLGVHLNTISGWERGNNLPDSKGIVLELAYQLHLTEQETRQLLDASLNALSSYWHLPYQRNPFFVGREDILLQLYKTLRNKQATVSYQSYILSGLGGIGKTQIAIEYAYRYANEYAAVFWINAATAESLLSSMVTIAKLLDLAEGQEQEQSRVIAAVTRWLTNHNDWLLIFDNVEDVKLIHDILPPARGGSLIFTSRRQVLGLSANKINLEPIVVDEGMRFLLHRAGLLSVTVSLHHLSPTDAALAQEIVASMDGLPLALDQAGAYIEATQCCLADYLQLLNSAQAHLLNEREAYADHPLSVTKTFALAFEQLEQSNAEAASVLIVCAFLAPEAIPDTFFIEGAPFLGSPFEELATDLLQFQAVIKALLTYSLIQRNSITKTLTVHRLVQVVLRENLSKTDQRLWVTRVLDTMTQLFPSDTMKDNYWQASERLLSHALQCLALSDEWNVDETLRVTLKCHVATYLWKRARFTKAEPLYQDALRIGEQSLGSNHPLIALILHGLAGLYRERGWYELAEPLFLRALWIREQVLGFTHLLVSYTCNNLGLLYWEQGKYGLAEPLYQRALQIKEQALGFEHPQVTHPLNNLGIIYLEQGKYELAEPLFLRVLSIWERIPCSEHPQIAYFLINLGNLYTEQGKYESAELLYKRALQISEDAYGSEHPQVAYPLTNLGSLYLEQGKYEVAEPLLQRALQIREQALGFVHPQVAYPLTKLGSLYLEQGKYEVAEPLLQRSLTLRQKHLGPQHPEVAESLYAYARFQQAQKQIIEALSLYQQALTIRERTLGLNHPKTRKTRVAYTHFLHELRQ